MSVLSQPTPQISVGPPPTLTYQVSVTNGQAYTLTVFQTLNGTNTVVVSPTSYTGTGSLQTYTFTSPVTSYAYFTRVLIGVTTTDSTSVLYYSPYQGPQGVQGNPGTVGGQGPIGPVGPQGPQGLQGVVSVTNYVTCNSLITSGTSSGTVNANANLTFNGTILDVVGQQRVTNVGGNILTISNSQSLTSNTLTTPNTLSSIVLSNTGTASTGTNFYNTSMLFNVGGYGGSIGGGLQNNVGAFLSLGTMVFNGAINPILNIVSSTTTNGNVGIGTTAPAYTLDVNGTIRGTLVGNVSTSTQATFQSHATGAIWYYTTDGSPRLRFVSGATSSSTLADSNSIIFQTPANTTMANITSTGMRVGDGTAASYMLDVAGNSRILCNANTSTSSFGTTNETLSLMSPCNGYTGGVASIYFGNATANYPLARIYAQDSSTGGNYRSRLVFQTNADSSSLAERMRIEAGGNVGINCNAPAYTLDVAGTTHSQKLLGTLTNTGAIAPISPFAAQNGNPNTGGSLAQIEFQYRDGGYNHYIATRHNSVVANNKSAIDFWLHSTTTSDGSTAPGTANVNMMSVTAAGVGINNSTPSYTLDVNGSINSTGNIYTRYGTAYFAYGEGDYYGVNTFLKNGSDGNGVLQVSYAGNATHGYLYLGAQGGAAHICISSNAMSINTGAAPSYTLDVGGITNVGPASGGTIYAGTSNGLVVQGASNGHGYIRADISTTSSDKILYLGTGQSNNVEINRTNVVFNVSNVVQVYGNLAASGTSYLNDISNTNVYATGGLFSGTTAGRLVMIGVQSGCYIEAGLDSTTGSAAPLYFTDTNNANQWMCIGSTGNVGINNNSPVGRFHVKTSGNALDTFLGWDSTWMVVTPAANAATAKNTPGLGLGYSVASNTAYVTALAPNDTWKNLRLDGSNIQLVPNGGSVNVTGSIFTTGYQTVYGSYTNGSLVGSVSWSAKGTVAAGNTATFTAPITAGASAMVIVGAFLTDNTHYINFIAYFDIAGIYQGISTGYKNAGTSITSGTNGQMTFTSAGPVGSNCFFTATCWFI